MQVAQPIKPDFFTYCPICLEEITDQAAISERCFHVFHRVCIEKWLKDEKDTCPNCKLPHFGLYELLPNPEYVEEYQKWKNDPYEYRIGAPQNIRPIGLRGWHRREELTPEEIREYSREKDSQFFSLNPDAATLDQLNKTNRETEKANNMMFALLGKEFKEIGEENKKQFADLAEIGKSQAQIRKTLEHTQLIQAYNKKADDFEKKIELEIASFEKQKPKPKELIKSLRSVSRELTHFSQQFDAAGLASPNNPGKPSIEESRELLKQVDAELDAYLESLPEDVKSILNRPLQEAVQPNPAPPQNNQQPPIPQNSWPSKRTVIKISLLVSGILVSYSYRLLNPRLLIEMTKNTKIQKPNL